MNIVTRLSSPAKRYFASAAPAFRRLALCGTELGALLLRGWGLVKLPQLALALANDAEEVAR